MYQSLDQSSTLSIKLSEVMEDIGVNKEIVMRTRRAYTLTENIHTVIARSANDCSNTHLLGSQSEGTTTKGLNSDLDLVFAFHDFNVMQDCSEWKQNVSNYLMIKDENATPGYCFLQKFRSNVPLPATHIPDDHHISDSNGKILMRNTISTGLRDDAERQGPSNAISGAEGHHDIDCVVALPYNSWPQSASHFLEKQGIVRWPSAEIIGYAESSGCFVVGASSKISTYPDLEWRISTSLAERCLIYNLNITQLHCYVLMKMILKTFLNPRKENGMSSFMCKTVLLHCIENTEHNIWRKDNLSKCLTYCLLRLHSCVQNGSCPHFMIPENNLMAGQFTVKVKRDLLKRISDVLQSDGSYLLRIKIDDINQRLQVKLNTYPYIVHDFPTPREIYEEKLSVLYINLAYGISQSLFNLNYCFDHTGIKQIICNLTNYWANGNRFEQLASRFLVPFLCSTLGSIIASFSIRRNNTVSSKAMVLLSLGMNSDVTSGRLKLASVFYCTGDMYRAEFILRKTERQYQPGTVLPICGCWSHTLTTTISDFKRKCSEQDENCIRHLISFCVRFLSSEFNCVPRELKYEMMRSTRDDLRYRSPDDKRWMDHIVIDSLPYLYFLQYNIYASLQRYQDKQHALNNLVLCIAAEDGFGHRETALNLLGQCMEHEGKLGEALQYYMLSLQQRTRNNAAKIHICCLIAKFARHI